MAVEFRTTRVGLEERRDDTRWMSPFHQTSNDVDTHKGVRRRSAAGIRSPNYFGGHVRGLLTDRAIDKYTRDGTYATRSAYLSERRKQKAIDFLPRLVYDPSTQEFTSV